MALDKLTKVQSVGISSFIQVVGVVTATGGFVGDGSGLTGITASSATGDFSIVDKIVHTGDTNTAIRFPAADTVTVETAGSERFRISSTGHVGIDCTPNDHNSFTRALDVNGPSGAAVYMRTNDSTSNCFIVGNYGSEAYINNIANGNIRFFTQGVEKFRISNTGLVGIGTVSPSGSIHAHAASGTQRSYLEASAAHSFLRLKSGSTSYNSGIEFFSGASNIANINGLGGGGLQFEVNGSERLRIHSSGVPQFTTTGTQYASASVPAFVVNSNGDHALVLNNQNTTDPRGLLIYQDQDVNNGTSYFWRARAGGTDRAHLYSNGTLQLHSGNLKLASGNGIDFSATGDGSGTVVSELLDDYEEGTFLPTVEWGGTSATLSGGTYGRYTKIGNTVIINFRIIQTNRNATSGSFRMYGLPYNEGSSAAYNHGMVQMDSGGNMPSGAGSIMMYIANTSTRFLYQTNTGHSDLDASQCVDGTAWYGFATYFVS